MRRSYGGLPILIFAFLIGVAAQGYFWYSDTEPIDVTSLVEDRAVASVGKSQGGCDQYGTSVRQWCGLIEKYADRFDVSPSLIAAVIAVESSGNPSAISEDGAVGLMQVMPRDGVARKKFGDMFRNRPSAARLRDPDFNVMYGTRMLSNLIEKYGLREGLKRYGPAGVGYTYADKIISVQSKLGD